jgi:hypothetical protein
MGDTEADERATGSEAPTEPAPWTEGASQLEGDAWFAQYLTDNAEQLARADYKAVDEMEADIDAAKARYEAEQRMAQVHHDEAQALRAVADDFAKKAAKDQVSRDGLETEVGNVLRQAETADERAEEAEARAAEAAATAKRLDAEALDIYGVALDHQQQARIRHDQARALERAADDERKVQQLHEADDGASRQ